MRREALVAAAVIGCTPAAQTPTPSAEQVPDTLRGTLIVEGNDPFPLPTVRTAAGRVVIDSAAAGLLRLDHLEVWLRGTRTSPDRFRVSDYRVRSANGAAAWDGILRGDANSLRLELDDGSVRAIRRAPSGLDRLIGSRIWFTENADGTLREYGTF